MWTLFVIRTASVLLGTLHTVFEGTWLVGCSKLSINHRSSVDVDFLKFLFSLVIPARLSDVETRALWGPNHHFQNLSFFSMLKIVLYDTGCTCVGSLPSCRINMGPDMCLPGGVAWWIYRSICLYFSALRMYSSWPNLHTDPNMRGISTMPHCRLPADSHCCSTLSPSANKLPSATAKYFKFWLITPEYLLPICASKFSHLALFLLASPDFEGKGAWCIDHLLYWDSLADHSSKMANTAHFFVLLQKSLNRTSWNPCLLWNPCLAETWLMHSIYLVSWPHLGSKIWLFLTQFGAPCTAVCVSLHACVLPYMWNWWVKLVDHTPDYNRTKSLTLCKRIYKSWCWFEGKG